MVLAFKGIAAPRQFPATVASGAPTRPIHACCEKEVDVCFQTLWRRGREGFATRATRAKLSPHTTCPQRAYTLCPHTGCTLCAPTRHVPSMWFSSSGPQNMGDWSGGVEEPNRGALRALVHRLVQMWKGVKIRIGCLNLVLSGAQKWAEMVHHPCILGGPQQRGQNQSGRKRGRKCYITPAFSGIPKQMGTKS